MGPLDATTRSVKLPERHPDAQLQCATRQRCEFLDVGRVLTLFLVGEVASLQEDASAIVAAETQIPRHENAQIVVAVGGQLVVDRLVLFERA